MVEQIPPKTLATIAEAFSRTAEKYDQFAENHPHLTRMRQKVYDHLERYVPAGARILELNSGTGTDAVYLANQGYYVHSTDIASGMLNRLKTKIDQKGLGQQVSFQALSFEKIEDVRGQPYDAVFSNLGGLNCLPNLKPVVEKLPRILNPGAIITWVLMPKICLWELATVFTGKFNHALRRLSSNGTTAHLEGLYFPIFYMNPKEVIRSFGSQYECLAIEGLSVFTPTAESKNLAIKHPTVYRTLSWVDDLLSPRWPWRAWGDFYMITFRYLP